MDVVKRRLGQYGAAWLGGFLIVLLAAVIARFLLGLDLIDAADVLISLGLFAMAGLMLAAVIATVLQPHPVGAKLLVLLLALVLVLPLFWAPVLAVVVAAWMAGVAIEYSQVYAGFRIIVSNLLYPVVSAIVSGAALRFVWELFQVFATIVGAIASAIQVWNFLRKLMAPRPAEAA